MFCALLSIVRGQIKALDQDLIKYRNALKKAKGPTAAGIKKRAMDTLKRKKMYEQQRDQMMGQQFNIEQTSFAIESVKDTTTTVSHSRKRLLSCRGVLLVAPECTSDPQSVACSLAW